MPNGGKLKVQAALEDGSIGISITYSGGGILERNMSKVFEPLFTTKTTGIGIGLVVSKKLVELNGG